ncbi:MAG: glycine--tRNA ligase subunit beta [Gammaproteobacteria bacterium]|nr:glycine--tRNA ligase subunit beta [Gammaproteobacteria bacterium]
MAECADLLFELGTEELPPVALKYLSKSLGQEFLNGLKKAGLSHGAMTLYATPRRLGLTISECEKAQPDRQIERRGPAVKAAFDDQGQATRAAEGFARSCGTSVDQLDRLKTDKGEWLMFKVLEKGRSASELLPDIAENALNRLPIPKRMRWGASEAQFVRPVHWLLFLHGNDLVSCTLLDAVAGRVTHGHRFHHPATIEIPAADSYASLLEEKGRVIAHFDTRQEKIRQQVIRTADTLGGHAEIDPALLDEVTSLVEWPEPIAASFEEKYLEVPHEALILTMKKNQKYFHLVNRDGKLMNHFIAIANIDSPTPEVIKEGNERVIRPRLSDAMFFWEQDGKRQLSDYVESLRSVVFQQKLGSMYDKSQRVAGLASWIASETDGDPELVSRAGSLSRCDLMTAMVGEFPDLQGIMGRYQARRDGEPEELAVAMDEFYMPRFSGDKLPATRTGIAISLAERIDTLVGIFGIGQKPTGDKDPFALRRAAIGALRILKDHKLPMGLEVLLGKAAGLYPDQIADPEALITEVKAFMLERLRSIYLDSGRSANLFMAVASVEPESLADFDRRINAVVAFEKLPEAAALSAANKRIRNILKKAGEAPGEEVDPDLFEVTEERTLHQKIIHKQQQIQPLLADSDYEGVLLSLAELREAVDLFFEGVMVMCEDPRQRSNRLALLTQLSDLFLGVADVSRLHT